MKLIEKQILDFKMYLDEEDIGICKELIVHGIREKPSVDYIKTILRPDMNVLDLGANIGFYVFIEAGVVNHVHAIEPVDYNFNLLTKNISLNKYSNISTYQLAIGSYNGTVEIYTSFGCNLATIIPENGKSGNYFKGIEEVPIYTLDKFMENFAIGQIDLLRMDVEGAEVDIIAGGLKTLSNMPKNSHLAIEAHSICLKDKNKLGIMFDQIKANGFISIKATVHEKELKISDIRDYIINGGRCPQVFFKKC